MGLFLFSTFIFYMLFFWRQAWGYIPYYQILPDFSRHHAEIKIIFTPLNTGKYIYSAYYTINGIVLPVIYECY